MNDPLNFSKIFPKLETCNFSKKFQNNINISPSPVLHLRKGCASIALGAIIAERRNWVMAGTGSNQVSLAYIWGLHRCNPPKTLARASSLASHYPHQLVDFFNLQRRPNFSAFFAPPWAKNGRAWAISLPPATISALVGSLVRAARSGKNQENSDRDRYYLWAINDFISDFQPI